MIVSPLRYPGGKGKLYAFFARLISTNNLFGFEYCEPYAGGAGLAIRLLTHGFVKKISLNDIDPAICAFWKSVFYRPGDFCDLISRTPVTIEEWHNQKLIYDQGERRGQFLHLGFATYFLNRTNRSGIIEGAGPIGGYNQKGSWKIDVRLSKETQIQNVQSLAKYVNQIDITCLDANYFIKEKIKDHQTLVYLDPPYYVKGHRLYKNFYNHDDHVTIADILEKNLDKFWICSYDDVTAIRSIYSNFIGMTYNLSYSAGEKSVGREVMYSSREISLPAMQGFCLGAGQDKIEG